MVELSRIRSVMTATADLIWPRRSLLSGEGVTGPGALTVAEWERLSFIHDPVCIQCGAPFEADLHPDAACGACLAQSPVYRQARAPLLYDDHSRSLVLGLKRAGKREGLAQFGHWMAQAGSRLLVETDWLVPVPLHLQRLAGRGYNQSVWLGAAVSRTSGVPMIVDALKRTRDTRSQGTLSESARARNVAGAFAVRPRHKQRVEGARILLIDDVLTTGATVNACARTLLRAGAADVCVLALARVARPIATPI